MEKNELIKVISKRANINTDQAEIALDQAIVELVSPQIFPKPGGEVGFINDNHCTNNCSDEMLAAKLRTQLR